MYYKLYYLPDMKVQIYFSFHLFILICLPISMHAKEVNVTEIITDLYENKTMCGSNLSDMMTALCRSFNAPRRRRSLGKECCKKPCNYYHIMKYYCKDPIIPIRELPPHPSSTMSPTNTWPLRKILPSPDSAQSSIERVSQSSENNYSGQGKLPLSNQINKDRQQSASYEASNRPPPKIGTMPKTTQTPVIFPHSNTIQKGHLNYSHHVFK